MDNDLTEALDRVEGNLAEAVCLLDSIEAKLAARGLSREDDRRSA